MKKRWISIICASAMMVGLLNGCGGNGVDLPKEDTVDMGEDKGKFGDVLEDIFGGTMKVKAENLTENLGTAINIDYSINSYEAVQNFSYELFMTNMEEKNPVLSPVSAYLALGMAGTGAKGGTLTEFQNVLGTDLVCIPHSVMTTLPREEEGMKISLANSAWVDDDFEAEKDYLVAIDSYYQSEVYRASLSATQTMDDMNRWIDTNTNGLIDKLLEEPLDEDVRLVLFNTIYFKGEWLKEFDKNNTREKEFTLADGSVEQVDMMHMYEENLPYVNTEEATGVILPYKGGDMAFVALMPNGTDTVREMYSKLTWEDISEMVKNQDLTLCNLQLPKFEVEFSKKLNDSLQEMGLVKAFDGSQADLSGMGASKDGENIFIDLVQQKAVVIVDEEGTEAAAVTEVVVNAESCVMYEEPPVDIFFNEPFVYMIVDLEKDIPLFVGIMDNPNTQK